MTVPPGETPQGLHPQMLPPPYTKDDKPPAYTDIYNEGGNVDAGTECMAAPVVEESAAVAQRMAAPEAPADETRPSVVPISPSSLSPPPPESALPPTPTTPQQEAVVEDRHATVTPGGGIAVV